MLPGADAADDAQAVNEATRAAELFRRTLTAQVCRSP